MTDDFSEILVSLQRLKEQRRVKKQQQYTVEVKKTSLKAHAMISKKHGQLEDQQRMRNRIRLNAVQREEKLKTIYSKCSSQVEKLQHTFARVIKTQQKINIARQRLRDQFDIKREEHHADEMQAWRRFNEETAKILQAQRVFLKQPGKQSFL